MDLPAVEGDLEWLAPLLSEIDCHNSPCASCSIDHTGARNKVHAWVFEDCRNPSQLSKTVTRFWRILNSLLHATACTQYAHHKHEHTRARRTH